jgi:UDP-3-O-[3-hydroxymyristoyl] glucosamine N-acyltransferase
MKEITFIGKSDAALSMFFEILYSMHRDCFSAHIVKNLTCDSDNGCPFEIGEVETIVSGIGDWEYEGTEHLVIGVNLSATKRSVYDVFNTKFGIGMTEYQRLIHVGAQVATTAQLSSGVILNPGVIVGPYSSLHELVTVNRGVTIGHHSTLNEFTTIHPGVNIAGHCNIGRDVTIGMGSNIVDGVSIGNNTVIGAGSLVTNDIPDNVIAYGSPAKIAKQKEVQG